MSFSVEALSLAYRTPSGPVLALDQVDLAVPVGGALGLVGESGSGKSTVALAAMGLLGPEATILGGSIRLGGTDLLAENKARGDRVALVFQDPFTALNPAYRIGEQVGEGLIHHRGFTKAQALARAIELLAEVGIDDPARVAQSHPHQLSGGMRQRALIASALACEPELLILDEPTTALDVTIEAQILDLLLSLRRSRKLSLLFISHNLAVVRKVCDQVAVIYCGQIVEWAGADALFDHPLHPYAKGLIASMPRLDKRDAALAPIPGRLPRGKDMPPGCLFEPRCPFAMSPCAEPQAMSVEEQREVRCWRAGEVADTPWPTPPPRVARVALTDQVPLVAATDVAKYFPGQRGLAAVGLDGWRPVYRPTGVQALGGVSLDIRPGEVVGLVGESGSGKSTLGRTILDLVTADSGSVTIDGHDWRSADASTRLALRRTAQIIFQNPDSSLNPRQTVGDIIARPLVRFAIVPAGDVAGRVAELLDLVQLPANYAARFPHQLSGGEKQRVGIARALAAEPRFVVCDEPVSALDVSVQAAIVNLLADLRDRLGVAYLFISHDISVVAHLADRVAVMLRGELVEIGPADQVLTNPAHAYTRALLAAVPKFARP